eukprot:4582562-Pyramimonas_sp.AAC.1
MTRQPDGNLAATSTATPITVTAISTASETTPATTHGLRYKAPPLIGGPNSVPKQQSTTAGEDGAPNSATVPRLPYQDAPSKPPKTPPLNVNEPRAPSGGGLTPRPRTTRRP